MARDKHSCVKCGQPASEVNHIKQLSLFPLDERWKANLPSNLEALCLKHHAIITAQQRKDAIVLDDPDDTSTSARNRKKKRMRKAGYHF
jgi:5-methylcytosine-specific restriction endonuclease McrA